MTRQTSLSAAANPRRRLRRDHRCGAARWMSRTGRAADAATSRITSGVASVLSSTKMTSASMPSTATVTRRTSSATLGASLKVGTMIESCTGLYRRTGARRAAFGAGSFVFHPIGSRWGARPVICAVRRRVRSVGGATTRRRVGEALARATGDENAGAEEAAAHPGSRPPDRARSRSTDGHRRGGDHRAGYLRVAPYAAPGGRADHTRVRRRCDVLSRHHPPSRRAALFGLHLPPSSGFDPLASLPPLPCRNCFTEPVALRDRTTLGITAVGVANTVLIGHACLRGRGALRHASSAPDCTRSVPVVLSTERVMLEAPVLNLGLARRAAVRRISQGLPPACGSAGAALGKIAFAVKYWAIIERRDRSRCDDDMM